MTRRRTLNDKKVMTIGLKQNMNANVLLVMLVLIADVYIDIEVEREMVRC